MKLALLSIPLVLALTLPALAEPAQDVPKRDAPLQEDTQQARKTDYWLSRDMQRLVFWQSREPAMQTGRSVGR